VRRIETDRVVAYVDRPWKMSLMLFAAGSVAIAGGAAFGAPRSTEDTPGMLFMYGWMGVLAGILLQYRGTAFLIDAAQGSLLILDRRFLRTTLRRELPLTGLEVRSSVADSTRFFGWSQRYYWIWIVSPDQRSFLFAHLRDQRTLQDLVSNLREDLRRAGTAPPLPAEFE
jgi:hypothetical protein